MKYIIWRISSHKVHTIHIVLLHMRDYRSNYGLLVEYVLTVVLVKLFYTEKLPT